MANFETKVRNTFRSFVNGMNTPILNQVARNLTLMALDGKLDACYHRDAPITAIQKILLRKSKPNVLLTGPAGCGKTAIAEGVASVLAERAMRQTTKELMAEDAYRKAWKNWDKAVTKAGENGEYIHIPEPMREEVPKDFLSDCVVFDLPLSALVGGTKYRGDLEERIQKILDECHRYPNIILFIDEIHQIISSGKCEGGEGVAQMLKPALSRCDIRVIGATTTDEAQILMKDKALARRFNEVEIAPLCGMPAEETAHNILADYSKHHAVTAEMNVELMLANIKAFLPKSVFPDNFINVVDETLAGCKFDGKTTATMADFNATLSRMAGIVIV